MKTTGVHLFHITPTLQRQTESRVILSIDDGKGNTTQFGPELSAFDKFTIASMLDPPQGEQSVAIRAHYDNVCWFLLDIMRLVPDIKTMPTIHAVKDTNCFPIYKYYDDTPKNRQDSANIAHCHAHLRTCVPPFDVTTFYDLSITASQKLINDYSVSLPLIRGKWLEIQGETHELYNYTIEDRPSSNSSSSSSAADDDQDRVPSQPSSSRFSMTLNAWPTHMVMGTELELDLVGQEDPVIPSSLNINNKRINFVLDEGQLTKDDIVGGRICRSNERMSSIIECLRAGRSILTNQEVASSRRIMSALMGTPCEATLPTLDSDMEMALGYRAQKPPDLNQAQWRRRHKKLKNARLRHLANTSSELSKSTFQELNTLQMKCAMSTHEVMSCRGYPGTGKTKTLAAYVLKRFVYNLSLPCGWIWCLTNSNVSACAIMNHLLAYPSLATCENTHINTGLDPSNILLRHAYSPLYAAYHPEEFKASFPYRLTPKAKLGTHGIMVSTIGKFAHVIKKYPELAKRTFDLVFDEVGQVWYLTGLAICTRLPNLKRAGLFGDDKQLPPYVTKLAGLASVQPSVMTPFLHAMEAKLACTHVLHKLDIQYRMIPVICQAHSPLFYEYPITTGRGGPPNPISDGAYIDILEVSRQSQVSYLESSCRRAIEIFQTIQALHLSQDDGTPYTFRIITPYVAVLERLLELRLSLPPLQQNVIIRTIDTSQGSEANVVIVVPGKSRVSDLNGCPYRGNVALSRAKEILVVIGTTKFFAAHPPHHTHLYHWGKWALAKGIKSGRGDLPTLCLQIRQAQRAATLHHPAMHHPATLYRPTPQTMVRKVNYAMRMAMALQETPMASLPDRKTIGRLLALKRKYSMNSPVNKYLYRAYLECSPEQLRTAIQMNVDITNNIERYTQLSALFGFDRFQPVDAKTDELARAAYPEEETQSHNRRTRQRRGRNDSIDNYTSSSRQLQSRRQSHQGRRQ